MDLFGFILNLFQFKNIKNIIKNRTLMWQLMYVRARWHIRVTVCASVCAGVCVCVRVSACCDSRVKHPF